MPITARNKLVSILTATVVFTTLATLAVVAVGQHFYVGMTNGLMVGGGVGCLEEFYVCGIRGRWMRLIHPLKSLAIYALMVWAIYLIGGPCWPTGSGISSKSFMRGCPWPCRSSWALRLPASWSSERSTSPSWATCSISCSAPITGLSRAGRLSCFSTSTVQPLSPNISGRSRRETSSRSSSSTSHGGSVYLYKGDGLIATWDWDKAIQHEAVLRAIDAMAAAICNQHDAYQSRFGLVPSYWIGIHGGEVVVSEQGDTKRSIGIYGDPINITARLEEAARMHELACVVSGNLVDALKGASTRMSFVGTEVIKGISHPVRIFAYCPT